MKPVLLSTAFLVAGACVAFASSGCPSHPDAPAYLSRDVLLDPQSCQTCHQDHYTDWSGSMHAYASDDPIFLAMNARGQRETNNQLGDFCVKCHAPTALQEGATTNGLNLATVPQKLKGVTCFFCHTVDAVNGAHDNPLHPAGDVVMRGPFADALATSAHPSAYATLHDRDQLESAKLCGACHDIVNGHGAAIERTFQEWQGTVFSHAPFGATCGQCHMPQSTVPMPVAQVPNAPSRRYHLHAFPGVDVALAPFPESAPQKKRVTDFLATTLQSAVCVAGRQMSVILDNVAAGHGFPSGSAQDRRLFVELIASTGGQVVYQSGVVPDGMPVTQVSDPDMWLLRDCMLDDMAKPVSMFWQASSYESNQLPGQITFDMLDPRFYQTHIYQTYPRNVTISQVPDRVTMRVRLQPMGLDVLDELVASKDLDPSVRAAMPTFDVGATVVWTPQTATDGYVEGGQVFKCVTGTNLNFQADKVLAKPHQHCSP